MQHLRPLKTFCSETFWHVFISFWYPRTSRMLTRSVIDFYPGTQSVSFRGKILRTAG
jgi:hypothetical protein